MAVNLFSFYKVTEHGSISNFILQKNGSFVCDNAVAFIVPKSNYIYAKRQMENETGTLRDNSISRYLLVRSLCRKLNDIWIVYLQLIHFYSWSLLWMMKSQCVFVTMKKSSYRALSLFWCFVVCEKLVYSPLEWGVRTWDSLSFSFEWFRLWCSAFGRVFFYISGTTEWFIVYPAEIGLELHFAIHSLCNEIQFSLFYDAQIRMFFTQNSNCMLTENTNVHFEFTVKYLWESTYVHVPNTALGMRKKWEHSLSTPYVKRALYSRTLCH